MEVLIAIAILAVFAPWLMRLPILHYKDQIQRFEVLDKLRIADWSYSEIKDLLFTRSISWENLPEFGQRSREIALPDTTLAMPGIPPKNVSRSFTMTCKKEKEGLHGEIFRLYEIKLNVGGIFHNYLILIQSV